MNIGLKLLLIYCSVIMSVVRPLHALSSHRNFILPKSLLSRRMSSVSDSTAEEVKTYLLEYKYVDNMIERRTPYRAGHIAQAELYISKEMIVAGGAFMPKVDGAMFIFKSTRSALEAFVKDDPYVVNGLVPEYNIREWNVVVGRV